MESSIQMDKTPVCENNGYLDSRGHEGVRALVFPHTSPLLSSKTLRQPWGFRGQLTGHCALPFNLPAALWAFNQEYFHPILPWLQRGMRDCQEPAAFQALLGLHMSHLI